MWIRVQDPAFFYGGKIWNLGLGPMDIMRFTPLPAWSIGSAWGDHLLFAVRAGQGR